MLLIGPLGTHFSDFYHRNSKFWLQKMHLEMSSAKCRPSWLVLNVLSPIWFLRRSQMTVAVRWRHIERDSVSNHQPYQCLLNRLFIRRSKKTSKLRVTGLCVENSTGTGEFPAQMASNAENVSIWLRHHVLADSCAPIRQQRCQLMSVDIEPFEMRSILMLQWILYQIGDDHVLAFVTLPYEVYWYNGTLD